MNYYLFGLYLIPPMLIVTITISQIFCAFYLQTDKIHLPSFSIVAKHTQTEQRPKTS